MKSPIHAKKDGTGSTGSLSTEGSTDTKSINESSTPEPMMSAAEEEEFITRHLKQLQNVVLLTAILLFSFKFVICTFCFRKRQC